MLTSVVFACHFDPETVNSLKDLRLLRRGVLQTQVDEIDNTLAHLISQNVISESEKSNYRQTVLDEIKEKINVLDKRISDADVFFSDEIELYLELLAGEQEEEVQ